jgi:hypothetical protein
MAKYAQNGLRMHLLQSRISKFRGTTNKNQQQCKFHKEKNPEDFTEMFITYFKL